MPGQNSTREQNEPVWVILKNIQHLDVFRPGDGLMQGWSRDGVGGLIELKNSKISISCLLKDINPIFKIFKI